MSRQRFGRALRQSSKTPVGTGRPDYRPHDLELLESRTLLSAATAAPPGGVVEVDPAAAAIQVARAAAAPLLASAVAVDNTSVLVNFSRSVTPAYAAKLKFAISGLTLSSPSLAADGGSVVLKTTAQRAATYTVIVKSDGSNASSTSFGRATFVGIPAAAAATPLLSSAVALDNTSVSISFSRAVTAAYAAKLKFSVVGLTLSSPTLSADGLSIALKTTPQKAAIYTLRVVSDGTAAPSASFGSATFFGVPAAAPTPLLGSAVAIDNSSVRVGFSKPVTPAYAAKLKFNIAGLVIASPSLASDGMSLVLKTTPQKAVIYTVKVVSDGTGSASASFGNVTFLGIPPAAPAPLLKSAEAVDSTSVRVYLNKLITPIYASKLKFSITGLTVLSARLAGDGLSILLKTSSQQGPGPYVVTVLSDGSKSPSASFGSVSFGPGPGLDRAVATSATSVTLTFRGAVGDSALSPSTYKIDQLDAAGNVVGSLAVTTAAFVGGQRTVVGLTTAPQSAARYRVSTTGALTDPAGATIAPAQAEFQGIAGQPTLVGVTSTGLSTALVTFSIPMSDDALAPSAYVIKDPAGAALPVLAARFVGSERRIVELTTSLQAATTYTITSITATGTGGGVAIVPAAASSFTGRGTPGETTPVEGAPRVVGAASLSNTEVIVSFSEPMADNAIHPEFYFIVQQNVHPESGYLQVTAAAWYDTGHSVVKLTTRSQNELTYAVTAVAMTDVAGNALASPLIGQGGIVIDPRTAQFPGTPPGGPTIVDADGDGLTDNVEMRGWPVTIQLVDGTTATRTVTSDPTIADTDGDGLSDYQEANIRTDPRNKDSDDDQLNDYAEFNEIYSNPLSQDSDGDTLDDFLEFGFFKTSPIQADTDGDQLRDDYEIAANRNPRVSDLPRPEITVGQVNLQLNVQFTETNDQQHRDLETRAVSSTLTQGANQTFARSDTVNVEAHIEGGYGDGSDEGGAYFRAGGSVGYTFNQSSESATSTEQAYQSSLSTDKEVTRGFTVQRAVQGAVMQVAIDLRNLSNLAYRVKNLQVTAFIQDPLDHAKLTPVATLLPDSEPADGFTLGPLTPDKGPFIFTNTSIVPTLVESLMANSSGLIFRISNYDIIDENGRNFAFSSREIVERTARLVIDYGGASSLRALLGGDAFDELKPGDETEIFRVSTSAGQVIDTNFDGKVDGDDRAATFDANGKEVGITVFEALAAAGLTRYDEAVNPTGTLSDKQVLGSYSTYVDAAGHVKIFRIRGIANDAINQKYWEILTPLGIDQTGDLNGLILKTSAGASLNFVQDLDKDGLSADVEYFLRTSDSPMPIGAEVPGTTDFATDESVTFSTDPILATGTIVRVTDTGGGLTAGVNYFVRSLGRGAYSFYDSPAGAAAGGAAGRIDLTGKITAGVFRAAAPTSTDTTNESVTFATDPGFPTGTVVQVTATGGGLTAGTSYIARNLSGGAYSFYDTAAHATAGGGSTADRVDLTGNVTGGIFSPTAKGRDTDGDGLDDPFEALLGWTVNTPQRTYRVFSSPNRADSNFDAPKPGIDSDGDGVEDRIEYDGSDLFAAPAGWDDKDANGLRGRFEVFQLAPQNGVPDYVLDPGRKDTDGDGINDATEIIGFKITPITGAPAFWVTTNPNSPFTDSDTFSDGLERLLGLDPTNGADTDADGDGLPDLVETLGWTVFTFAVSTTPYVQGAYAPGYNRHVTPNATDLAADAVKFNTNNDPNIQRFSLVQVTGGGLTANAPYFLGRLVEQSDPNVVKYGLYLSATDAAGGTGKGLLDLTAPVTDIFVAAESRKSSRTDAVDSDGDGLSDYDEFFLGTDPSSIDSDHDGIDDRIENAGYSLGHKVGGEDLGIIKTDPLDADTDNDKRSDGAEAELKDVEQARWVVRVSGLTPYRAYSNPLVADSDYDSLVDGDEFAAGTDPGNGNTDDDKRSDDIEVRTGTNPLAADVQVTVVAQLFNSSGSQYAYGLSVRKPDQVGTGVAGLSATQTPVVNANTNTGNGVGKVIVHSGATGFVGHVYYKWIDGGGAEHQTADEGDLLAFQTGTYNPGLKGVPVGARFRVFESAVAGNSTSGSQEFIYTGTETAASFNSGGTTLNHSLDFTGVTGDFSLNQSLSFGLATGEHFSIEGFFTNTVSSQTIQLGGINGIAAKQVDPVSGSSKDVRTIFAYADVVTKFIQDYSFTATAADGTVATLKFLFIVG